MLHSLLADRTIFDRIVPELSARRRIIIPSLPGFGSSSRAGFSAFEVGERVIGLFGVMGLGKDVDVLGNGFGAFIAAGIGIRFGGHVSRLVLSNCGATFDENGKAAFRVMAARANEAGMSGLVDVAMQRLFPPDFIAAHSDLVAARRSAFLKIDPTFFAGVCDGLANLDLRAAAGEIKNPSLIISGGRDTATPSAMGRALANLIRGAKFVELAELGHAPMAQDPERFLGVVTEFFEHEAALP
jgi:3-oxoadipate enol-lactonase